MVYTYFTNNLSVGDFGGRASGLDPEVRSGTSEVGPGLETVRSGPRALAARAHGATHYSTSDDSTIIIVLVITSGNDDSNSNVIMIVDIIVVVINSKRRDAA